MKSPVLQKCRAWILRAIVWVEYRLKALAIRLVWWTGKSTQPIHPKHLICNPLHDWYMEHIRPGDRVLDVGCGIGMPAIKVTAQASRVVGFDHNLRNLHKARHLQEQRGAANVSFLAADAEGVLPFADACFDRALLLDVIEHLHRRVDLLREVQRVLRPEGMVLLSAPNVDSSWKRKLRSAGLPYYADGDHKIEYTLSELAAELAAAGLKIVGEPQIITAETPLAGIIDLVGGISLRAYARLGRWKRQLAERNPRETTGWRVVCRRM